MLNIPNYAYVPGMSPAALTMFGGVSYNTTNGGVFVLDGSTGYLDLGGDRVVKTTGGWAVESWFNLSAVNSGSLYNFIGSNSIVYNSWYWTVYQSKLALWNISPGAWYYGSTTIQPNTWYQAVLVSSTSGTSYRFYLNGVAEGGDHVSYSWNSSYAGLRVGWIGRADSVNGRYFNGKYPICKIYNRPLTADEVRASFLSHRSRFGI
jgi:hypothetical protein